MFLHIWKGEVFYIKIPAGDHHLDDLVLSCHLVLRLVIIKQFEIFKMASKMAARIRKTTVDMGIIIF